MRHLERMIWAAAFIKDFDISDPPYSMAKDANKWEDWEKSQTLQAMEYACGVIWHLRNAVKPFEKDFGKDSYVTKILREMMDDNNG